MVRLIFVSLLIFATACAKYQFGNGGRVFPGGYDRIAIPIFANGTNEVGVETYFAEALRVEFERSRLAEVTAKNDAQVILEGRITGIAYSPTIQVTSDGEDIVTPNPALVKIGDEWKPKKNPLPAGTVLTKEYLVTVSVQLVARKVSDSTVLWQGNFNNAKTYYAPLLGTPGISNSGPIYNQSYRQMTIARMARDMMSEAHDRITENF